MECDSGGAPFSKDDGSTFIPVWASDLRCASCWICSEEEVRASDHAQLDPVHAPSSALKSRSRFIHPCKCSLIAHEKVCVLASLTILVFIILDSTTKSWPPWCNNYVSPVQSAVPARTAALHFVIVVRICDVFDSIGNASWCLSSCCSWCLASSDSTRIVVCSHVSRWPNGAAYPQIALALARTLPCLLTTSTGLICLLFHSCWLGAGCLSLLTLRHGYPR